MSKKVNYGTVNNKKSGVKNRFFKYVLCFCLGVVSLLGIGAKMTANAQVLDIDAEKVVTSDNSLLNEVIDGDYTGYYDIVGCSGDNSNFLEFRFFDFNNNHYEVTGGWNALKIASNYSVIMLSVSSYNDLSGLKVSLSSIGQHIKYLDLSFVNIMPNGVMGGVSYLFCSRYLYNLYLTSQNSGGASSSELEAEYNKGYSAGSTDGYNTGYSEGKTAGITEGTTTGYNSGYNEGYAAGYDKCEDDSIPLMQEKWQNGYDIGKGEGINEGIRRGYNDGYNAGLEDNQDDIFWSGYDSGYGEGKDFGLEQGYNNAKEEYYSDQSNFKNLMFSIMDAPFNVLSNAFDFEIFGINMSSFLIAIVSLLLVCFVIRKLM